MGIGEFPQQAENRFRVTKALLAEEFDSLTKRLIDAKIKEKIAGGICSEAKCCAVYGQPLGIEQSKTQRESYESNQVFLRRK